MFKLREIMGDKYKHDVSNKEVDVVAGLAPHWRSMHSDDDGVSMFSVTPQRAKWLLHTLKHNPVTPKQADSIRRLERVLSSDGIKSCMPKSSILIDPINNTLLSGVTRLYSVSMASKGTYLAIEFITE
ncbi:hypothetical protein S140_198 [Shewanella sp. phage 1/40]|uniref:hypothetical protein n=1 Tax=Shewanella sp. phage 1/40 TaxID=1458860 RepID=UPI0004F802C6|nr:hypothetical protein S140_198 [Shewanella sp. phage 1/40]AHK11605.1 hypothetical protein S140_198 [Shewanella sp. phage 1/40]